MTTITTGHRGFLHELFLYRSTEELLEFVVPLAWDGVVEAEPTLLLLRDDAAQAVRHEVGPSPYLAIESALPQSGDAAQSLSAAGSMLPTYSRVVHQEPVIAPAQWPEWRRLEAVLNLALRHHDSWAVCAYDQRTLTADMVEDLHATHPVISQDGAHGRSDRYRHPINFLVRNGDDPPHPIERTAPAIELVDPSPAAARAGVKWFAHQSLPNEEIDKLVFATHEAVTNALRHGLPPTVLRLWSEPGRVTVTVTDAGPGPIDPVPRLGTSYFPDSSAADVPTGPAMGLWLIHQLVEVTRSCGPDGYTIRLTATDPDNPAG